MIEARRLFKAGRVALPGDALRVLAAGVVGGPITGKLTRVEGCLFVQFDRPIASGFHSARRDQVLDLQVYEVGGWVGRSVKSLLKHEPTQCFEEGNG